ncbi:MAG: hypothetical protein M1836_000530 [Candelina mexicana]|nr:MAG: hypothetical protein M1836_000530 [Candelina mexicana]
MPTTAQAGSTSSGSTPTVSASTYSSVLLGTNTVDSLVPSALAYGVVMTSPTSGSITRPSYGLRSGSSTITSTVTVSPLPYGSRSSSYTVTSQSPIVGSPVVSPEIATSGTSGLDSVYGPSPSVPGSSIVPTSYTISPALVSSSSTISLAPGSYLLTTDIYGSPTALLFSPSVTSAIRGYLVAPVQGSSTSAGAMPGYTPVYTPEILGNAYGGGFVSTPTVYVSSTAGSGVNGIPPGYGFSILVVGSSTTTAYASGPSYVSTSLTNPTANGLHGYNSASTVSSSISGSITSLPSQSSQSGNPSTTPYNQGRSSSTAAGAGAANVAAVAPLSVNNGGSISSATSTAGAVRAVPSSTTSSKGNMTSSVSPTTPVIFTGDAVQGRVASLGFVLGLLLLIHML